jgi:predicted nucleic acid-binding protein
MRSSRCPLTKKSRERLRSWWLKRGRTEKRPKMMDTSNAATAVAHDIPVYTQDEDFAEIPKVRVHQV